MNRETDSQTTPLAWLAARCGIADHYIDIWGERHPTSAETQKALLRAMGIAADSEEQIAAALEQLDHAKWTRPLPAILVVPRSKLPARIPVHVQGDSALGWRIVEENGPTHTGQSRAAELPLLDEAGGYARRELMLDPPLPLGYHRLELYANDKSIAACALVVVPDTCYRPAALESDGRVFGPALQLYAVRSERNWGMGDFTDLRRMIEIWAREGAAVIGVNPLTALFPHNPLHSSPYSPSSRLFLNVLYLDVEAIPDFLECEGARSLVTGRDFQLRLAHLRDAEFVDYAGVAAAKMMVLELLFQHFRDQHLARGSERANQFRTLTSHEGAALFQHALFEALQEHFHRGDPNVWGWPVWPEPYRDPVSPEVARFAEENRERIEFYQYLQWNADLQLDDAGKRCLELGVGVGLYLDLPVSIDSAGAESWSNQWLYATGARVGVPPDEWNPNGQDWGLPPFNPEKLTEAAYAPWIGMLRHNMRHAGAIRIDHVMQLLRLFWVPPQTHPSQGTYVYYRLHDLLGIVALESQRNQCLVVGEDLGTVPDEVRDALGPLGVLSYRLLYFEKNEQGDFKPPSENPRQALIAISTHDLPTLAGYWQGQDLNVRTELQLFPSDKLRQQAVLARSQDRARLLLALEQEELLPDGMTIDPASAPVMTPELARALHRYAARSPAQLMMTQIEDITGQLDQVNLPTTTDQYRNWQKKNEVGVEQLARDPRFTALTSALREERGTAWRAPPSGRPPLLQIPGATYRLQFNSGFTFADAASVAPYLARLGITHCYASPYLKARPGSTHGYDIIDHNALNPEIGGREDYDRFTQTLAAHGMGQVLDLVPNHMGVMGCDNAWWLDVLENGQASAYASFFDIDWEPLKDELRGKVLLPLLGDHYGAVLERGELKLVFDQTRGSFSAMYYNHCLPIGPRQYPILLKHRMTSLEASLAPEKHLALELQSVITAFEHLPQRLEPTPEKIAERHRDKEFHKQHLAELCAKSPQIREAIEAAVREYSGRAGEPSSFELLHALLELQSYRLAYWRVASDEINYRRFFDINDLAALRMENREVFDATHQLVLKLIAEEKLQGLRLDHPDGLYDPAGYYARLQEAASAASQRPGRIYMLVEKILAAHEHLPEDWEVAGTTGYDFANLVNGLFVDPQAERRLDRFYADFIGHRIDFDELLYECKKLVLKHALASELNVLARDLDRITVADRHTRDFTLSQLRAALAEVIACFPVYRTYVRAGSVTPMDRRYVDWAVARAKKKAPDLDASIFDFIRSVLLLDACAGKSEEQSQTIVRFAMKFPQVTSPATAKSLEDTAFYRYCRLTSLNEVGGDPRRFSVSVNAFHLENQERARRWPHGMLATSTHDNKRSEDVRARINVLSELAEEWREHVRRWARVNRNKRSRFEDAPAPSRNDEYLLYQTLIGAWPLEELGREEQAQFCERIEQYMIKAAREAKSETSWVSVNEAYEKSLTGFVRALLDGGDKNLFLADFLPFQKRIARLGLLNSLSQTLLKLTAPGVPDFYQGNEIWDFSLVDPDNRRPVDYARRQAMLDALDREMGGPALAAKARSLLDTLEDGRAKLYLTSRTLKLRGELARLFRRGEYLPLPASGRCAEHLIAFARRRANDIVIAVAPRLFARLCPEPDSLPLGEAAWGDTAIEITFHSPGVRYANILTGEVLDSPESEGKAILRAASIFANFPAALLVRKALPETA